MLALIAAAVIGGSVGALVTLAAVAALVRYGWRPVMAWFLNSR